MSQIDFNRQDMLPDHHLGLIHAESASTLHLRPGVLAACSIISMYALESKKRKFDRLLQSINKSQTSLPLAQELETPKKRRVTAPPSLSKRPRLSGVNNGSVISLNRPRPNYLPHSQEAFFERLRTFAPVQKWRVSSTEEINAAEWAKRGWSCVGDDMVACNGGCNEQLLVKLEDSPDDDEADEDPEKTLLDDVEGFSDHEEDDKRMHRSFYAYHSLN